MFWLVWLLHSYLDQVGARPLHLPFWKQLFGLGMTSDETT